MLPEHLQEVEDQYFNIYVLIDHPRGWGQSTVENDHPAVIEWLYTNVGTRRAYGREWHHPDGPKRHDWSVGGIRYTPQDSYYQFMVSDRRSAQLLKMAFGAR